MKFPYSDTVLEHFRHPHNVGKIEDPDGKATEGSPACGDMVAVYISVDEASRRISDIKFESYGCASNIATGSIITELAMGKTLDEARKITWKQAADALGGLPAIKAHCSVLAIEGLRSAIQNYEERHGLVKERKPTTVEVVRRRLRKVVSPITGLSVVRSSMVDSIEVKDGTVRVVLDLPAAHQFAPAMKQEVLEKIDPLWDVQEVVVDFTE
ncbi:MAG: iron-sulfur cluster assembly scaffold protein [Dehalococcoidales bacterium]|nr:iron-sulfur cluster assembly scaffold protein [Dehalococcoidales bacterium]